MKKVLRQYEKHTSQWIANNDLFALVSRHTDKYFKYAMPLERLRGPGVYLL